MRSCEMSTTSKQSMELEELRAENGRLHAILAARGVNLLATPANYPTEREQDQLHAFALVAYPSLGADVRHLPDERAAEIASEYARDFRLAFWALCFVRRSQEIDRSRYPVFWKDQISDILKSQFLPHDIGMRAFTCAIIA